jgi:glycosyltransferase involved in cell wall biosynthesis
MRVVGPDEAGHRSEIDSMVQAAGLEDAWSLEDAVSDEQKWDLYRESDLFILPTHSENFGISVAEALASGLPVITTTGAPWRGLVEHQCGWWVDPSVDDLAGALQEATSNRSVSLKSMGDRGREWVARDFSWKGIAQSMLNGYKNLIINQSHERRP